MYAIRKDTPRGITIPYKGISSEVSAIDMLRDIRMGYKRSNDDLSIQIYTPTRLVLKSSGGDIIEYQVVNQS